tara:strand:- start:300 stop:464 length:165 start_codon:yes stop_codon:yes gene_type:complete
MEITKEHLGNLKTKMEEAKTIYLKYVGAVEIFESLLQETVEKPKKEQKVAKAKK